MASRFRVFLRRFRVRASMRISGFEEVSGPLMEEPNP